MSAVMGIVVLILRGIYFFMKLRRTQNRVVFISRQDDKPSLDFTFLIDELKLRYPNTKITVLTKKIRGGTGLVSYAVHVLMQMGALATSCVCILDSYCIPVSVLNHKKDLTVIQMWHAIGLMKKAGYSIIGTPDGRGEKIASALKMHKNYDIIFASSEACRKPMSAVFSCSIDRAQIYLLPRVDALRSEVYAAQKKEMILARYSKLADPSKKNILYIPTLRKNEDQLCAKTNELISVIDYSSYNLIIKPHPLSKFRVDSNKALLDDTFTSLDMLFVADYVVADYSGMLFDVLVYGVPIYFYAFDFDDYEQRRGWFIDYEHEIPGELLKRGSDVFDAIKRNNYSAKRAQVFLHKYVELTEARATDRIADLVNSEMQ